MLSNLIAGIMLVNSYWYQVPVATDPSYNSVTLLLHGDGANNGTVFTDSSRYSNTVNVNGASAGYTGGATCTSTAEKKFGTASINCYPASVYSYLTVNLPSAAAFGTNNFTIEFWSYLTSTTVSGGTVRICGNYCNNNTFIGSGTWLIGLNGTAMQFAVWAGSVWANQPTSCTLNRWEHYAFVRSGQDMYSFINGVGTTHSNFFSQNYNVDGGTRLQVSIGNGSSGEWTPGYLDDFRITVGVARYTANFAPPTAAFPNQ